MTRWPLIALIALTGFPANAQVVGCGVRLEVVRELAEKFGEARKSLGVSGQNVVEVWVSEATGSWTILKTKPNGVSCVMLEGVGWQDELPATPPGKDS